MTAFVRRLNDVEDQDFMEELGLSRDVNHPANLLRDAVKRIEAGNKNSVLWRALKDLGILVGHVSAGSLLTLAPSTITFTGSASCEPVEEGFRQGVSERGGFFMRSDDHAARRITIHRMSGQMNSLGPARGAALTVFRDKIYRNLEDFSTLLRKSGQKHLAEDQRLFAGSMHPISRNDLPIGSRPRR